MRRDGSRQLRHVMETPGLDALLRDVGEETPDEAHPKTRGRDEVYVEPGRRSSQAISGQLDD